MRKGSHRGGGKCRSKGGAGLQASAQPLLRGGNTQGRQPASPPLRACWKLGAPCLPSPSGPSFKPLDNWGVAEQLRSSETLKATSVRSGVEGVLFISYFGSKVKVQEQIERAGARRGSSSLCPPRENTSFPFPGQGSAASWPQPAACPGLVPALPCLAVMAQPLPPSSPPSRLRLSVPLCLCAPGTQQALRNNRIR